MGIRDLILPEDRLFFDLFDQMAEYIEGGSEELVALTGDLSGAWTHCRAIRQKEHDSDGIVRQIFERLDQSLITPLEPEEISRLAPALDDVMDRIDRVAHQICNYGITESTEPLREFSRLILQASHEIRTGIRQLKGLNTRELQRQSVEMNRLWNLSGEILSTTIPALFKSNDPMTVIKYKDIYEGMEVVLQKCNDLGHVLNDIALAHG
jgi:uncharacterized protein Yka (UPF0111/DUF47 family)